MGDGHEPDEDRRRHDGDRVLAEKLVLHQGVMLVGQDGRSVRAFAEDSDLKPVQ